MNIICRNHHDAKCQAARLRRIYKDTDWRVKIRAPLYDGDSWRVVVS